MKSFDQRNPNERNLIYDGELLQANATVIAGTLVFLTINSLAGSGGIGVPTIYITYGILIPFSVSSIFIVHRIALKNVTQKVAKWSSTFGFVYLIIILPILHQQGVAQFNPPAVKCAKNPTSYNVTHVSDCSKFTPGSLAEDCALHSENYNLTPTNQPKRSCSELITTEPIGTK